MTGAGTRRWPPTPAMNAVGNRPSGPRIAGTQPHEKGPRSSVLIRQIERFLAILTLLLAVAPALRANPQTFNPELKRLNSMGAEVSSGTLQVTKSDTLYVGIYVDVSTTETTVPTALGLTGGALNITLSGTGLTSTAVQSVLSSLTETSDGIPPKSGSYTENPSLSIHSDTVLSAALDDARTKYTILYFHVLGQGLSAGVYCSVTTGESGCEIFLGTLAIPLSVLSDADYGTLTVNVAWDADGVLTDQDGVRRGTKGPPSSVEYRINPALPFLSGPAVNGGSLTLTASASLDSTTTPANSAFTVKVNGTDNAVTNVGISGTTVTLTLTNAVIQSDAVTVAYDPPTTDFLTTGTEAVLSLAEADVTNNTLASADATLSGISLDNVAVNGFDRTSDQLVYTAGVASTVSQPVLRATPNNAGAIVNILADDGTTVLHTADRGEPTDYTVPTLSANQPRWLKVQVEPEDTSGTTIVYDLVIGRGSTLNSEWKVVDDFESGSLSGNRDACRRMVGTARRSGWPTSATTGTRPRLPRFSPTPWTELATTPRTSRLPSAITTPYGIWGDSDTIFVANSGTTVATRGLYAFKRSDRTRDSSKDLGVGESAAEDTIHETVTDLWSDGQTLWTAAGTDGVPGMEVCRPSLATRMRPLPRISHALPVSGRTARGSGLRACRKSPEKNVAKILAYDLSTKSRLTPPPPPEFEIDDKNASVLGLWSSDGATLYAGNSTASRAAQAAGGAKLFTDGPEATKILFLQHLRVEHQGNSRVFL